MSENNVDNRIGALREFLTREKNGKCDELISSPDEMTDSEYSLFLLKECARVFDKLPNYSIEKKEGSQYNQTFQLNIAIKKHLYGE